MLLTDLKEDLCLSVDISISLKNINEDFENKLIFCNIEYQLDHSQDFVQIGFTESIKYTKYVTPVFKKHIQSDFQFEKDMEYRLNFFLVNEEHVERMDQPENHFK
jgi:hypothetical protein